MKRSPQEPTDIVEKRKIEANKVVDTDCLVAKYELLIKEHDAKRMSEERSALLFQVFDNLIPHLGVFKPIFSKIREELYEYVFSDEHHTARASKMTNISGSRTQTAASNHVDRVPHYLLLKKLVQSVTMSLMICNHNLIFCKKGACFKHQLIDLEKKLAKQESVSRRLQMEIEDTSRAHQETEAELNRYCDSLQFDCNEKDEEIKYLSTFKEGYDRLDEDFIDQTSALVPTDTNRFNAYQPKETVVATKKEHIVSNLLSTKKFKEQILTVMNTMIEQYDEYLEEQKTDIAKKKILNNPDVLATRKMDREIDQADQELWSMQERFKGAMEEINEELSLLQQHQDMLEEQLATIVEDEQKSKPKGNKKAKPKQKEKAPDEPITLEKYRK
ncbi:hypothetical protein EB796_021652 [Bugula neritina]|uniref:Uncharacterized protein n=1 Tax=Bugula neritina TaxID=10212 RepID=A0A7J7J1L5_BUGNE|nr:hypothetical protein EB796_021652 [Bugula neritina]